MGQCCGEFTFNSFLTLNLASASENQSLWIHRRKVFCCLKPQSPVRPSDYNNLARKVGGDERYGSGELFFQERENRKLGHCEGVGADKQVTPLAG